MSLILAFVVLMVAVIPVAHALVIASGIALLWDGGLPLLRVARRLLTIAAAMAGMRREAAARVAGMDRQRLRG